MPDEAKCVFKGQIFDVYQWPQKMFDGSVRTFEALRRPDTVQIIAVKEGKIVMTRDRQPHKGERLGVPGGRVDEEDGDWRTAAQRELLEETGLQFRQWRLVYVTQPQPKIEWFGVVFVAWDLASEQPAVLDAGGEEISVLALDFDSVKSRVMNDEILGFLRPVFSKVQVLEDLLALPAYSGTEVDR